MGVENLVILITGAGTARLAASRGARVVLSGLNSAEGEALAAEIRGRGGQAVFQRCDVTCEDEVQSLMRRAADTFGGIDVLHNNAGIHESLIATELSLEHMSRETFEDARPLRCRAGQGLRPLPAHGALRASITRTLNTAILFCRQVNCPSFALSQATIIFDLVQLPLTARASPWNPPAR